jgi:hypothetical protein
MFRTTKSALNYDRKNGGFNEFKLWKTAKFHQNLTLSLISLIKTKNHDESYL